MTSLDLVNLFPADLQSLGFTTSFSCASEKLVHAQWFPSDAQVRDLALEALQVWLNKHDNLSDVEMQKLWKALFYYIWMADKETEIEKVNCCTISSGHVWKTENAESRTRETGHRQGCWVIRYSRNAVYSGIV
mmetsp:Transcript_31031/g.119072  ORF Transcript_31031/g.119072 Transcript_31031/m.119072 type:complete len:133 (-) Transcript_31031:3995-4393(-)